ncbi:MAG TPA: NHL repeat-containing protein [Planctomycetota bacterium]|nr:NHL repeat-containing protein [Planctomycetota bacterium]
MFALLLALLLQVSESVPEARAEPFGRWTGTIAALSEPAGVAVDAEGRVVVVETVPGRVRVFSKGGEELARFGEGELLEPVGVALAPDGGYFVSDAGHHRVVRFDSGGAVSASFGSWGAADGELNEPRGLVVAGERLWVCDTRNHRLQAFALDGTHARTLGGFGGEPGQFQRPCGIAFDGAGALFVADTGNQRVQKFDLEGAPVAAWGDFGPYPGFFSEPTGIATSGGRVYVADRDNHRVQVFDAAGELDYDFGIHALLPREGDGKVHYPEVLALAPDGSFLALAESFEDRVQLFERWPAGGTPPVDPLRFERDQSAHYGAGVTTSGGYMALVEPGSPSLLLWDLELEAPIQVSRIRTWGARTGQFRRPTGCALDGARNLVHVSDPANRRISSIGFTPRAEGEPLIQDPFLLRFVRSIDLATLAELRPDVSARPIEPEALCLDDAGNVYAADVSQRAVFAFAPNLEPRGRLALPPLGRPVDLEWDAGKLLVVDQLARCVRVFDLSGDAPRELAPIGGPEDARGALLRPAGLVRLSDGRLWVSDEGRHRIAEFAADGELVRTFGGPGLGRVEFHKPRGLDQDARGRVFAIDWGNLRGILLDAEGGYLDAFGARFFTKEARLGK